MSSEAEELLSLCHRILVMRRHRCSCCGLLGEAFDELAAREGGASVDPPATLHCPIAVRVSWFNDRSTIAQRPPRTLVGAAA